jgi:hypothetical protein
MPKAQHDITVIAATPRACPHARIRARAALENFLTDHSAA